MIYKYRDRYWLESDGRWYEYAGCGERMEYITWRNEVIDLEPAPPPPTPEEHLQSGWRPCPMPEPIQRLRLPGAGAPPAPKPTAPPGPTLKAIVLRRAHAQNSWPQQAPRRKWRRGVRVAIALITILNYLIYYLILS